MIAYFDCFSGASGNMILGALLDAGLELKALQGGLSQLGLDDEYHLEVQEVHKGVLRACHIEVRLTHEHTHQVPEHKHNHHSHPVEESDHLHPHEHAEDEQLDSHHGHYRGLREIVSLIESSPLSLRVKRDSIAIFTRLAESEAAVHGTSLDEIHFHEVGAVDALVDVVGTVIGLEALGVEDIYVSPLPLGGGAVECTHGLLPLPAPATLHLVARAQVPVVPPPGETRAELVTPTGAAILTTLARFVQPRMRIQAIGYGAGNLDLPWPNVLRLWVGEPYV